MLHALVLSALTLAAPAADTTLQIPRGSHVVIEHSTGDIDILGVSGREARVTVDGVSRGVEVSRADGTFHISAGRIWDDGEELVVRLPRDVSVEVQSLSGDVRVYDLEGEVDLATIEGDIEIEGTGAVTATTADGNVRVSDIAGDVLLSTADGDSWVHGVSGNVTVHAIDGDITVLDADAPSVDLQTIDGDVRYEGVVYDGGRYALSAHDGNVTFALPEGAGATLTVTTFDGSFETSFSVQFSGGPLRGAQFTVGDGSARVDLEVFDGDIHLIRPGERAPGRN